VPQTLIFTLFGQVLIGYYSPARSPHLSDFLAIDRLITPYWQQSIIYGSDNPFYPQ
jgi:hypothetical protein